MRRVRSLSAPWKKLCNGSKFFSASLKKNSIKLSCLNPVILSGVGVQIKSIMKNGTSLEKLDLIAVQIKLDPQPI